jgi:membrane protein implicated in regulation of membrane protease activity
MSGLSSFFKPEILWALAGLLLLLLEFMMPGLVIFFFGVGALIVAGLCLLFDLTINPQLIIFVVSSVVLLVCLRKWLKGIFMGHSASPQSPSQNLDEVIGQSAVTRTALEPGKVGRVEFHGADWNARAEVAIEEGVEVEITKQDNLTLLVKPKA